jgi:glycerol-3-phosphate O-acyltransferase
MVGQGMASVYNQGIHVDRTEVERLKEIARKAERAGQSLILLPPHRSHIDYVTLQWIFFRLGLSMPLGISLSDQLTAVVSGDNLRIPLLGEFLQNAGAFYIRRAWGDDALYATVVQAYVDILLAKGYNFECFIEGTRSRTG